MPANTLAPLNRASRAAARPHTQPSAETLALLDRAQHGDRDAFAALYLAFREPVTRYVTVRMRDRDRDGIEDLVQETFAGALAELPSALLDVRGWFIIQAAKACTRHDRSRRRYLRAALTIGEQTRREPVPPPASLERPARVTFIHALARLTDGQRRAIQLRYLDGHSRDAAAELMGRSREALKGLERRAIRRMRTAAGTVAATTAAVA